MIKILLIFLSALFFSGQLSGQVYSQLYSGRQEMFLEAESYHLFEEYNEALPLYIELLRENPENAFLNYRIGTCYINIPGQKEMAIEYFEQSITDMAERDRRPTLRTTKAPLDALFFLGHAYHINYQFEKALDMYHEFKEKLNPSVYNIDIVNEHIISTKNAMESIRNPIFFVEKNLGERINTRFSETNPVVSGNKEVLVFTRRLQFYDAIFFSERTDDGEWSWPLEITPQIGSDGDCYPVSLSYDGKELYLYKSDDLVGNIYVSRFSGLEWSPIRKLNDNINSRYWESHVSISKDGNTLYFASNRPGGFGGLDIYYSKRNTGGDWGPAVNIGPEINTPFNDDTPFISEDSKTLYFSSYGHYNIGGYDVFRSTRQDGDKWSEPVNAGYGINTPDDDLFFLPVRNGIYAFVSKFDDDGFGATDIFMYEFFSDANPRKFILRGRVEREDGMQTGSRARIIVTDPLTGDTLYTVTPDQLTGEFEMMVEAGDWQIIFSEEGHDDIVKPLNLPLEREDPDKSMHARLERREPVIPGIEELITDSIILPKESEPEKTLSIREHIYQTEEDETISHRPHATDELLTAVGETGTLDTTITNLLDAAPGSLAVILSELDISREDIATPGQLIDYLIRKQAFSDYDTIYQTPADFIHALLPHVSAEMAALLSTLLKEEKVPETVAGLIRLIIESSEEHGYSDFELLDALSRIPKGEVPAEEELTEIAGDGRKCPSLWLLLLAILLLAAYYYKEQKSRKKR